MANTIKVHFWLHRSKKNKIGLVPLIIRLTYKGKRVDKASGHYIDEKQWNINKQRLKRNKANESVNRWIDIQIVKITNLFTESIQSNSPIHLEEIMELVFVSDRQEIMLLEFIASHNQELKKRVGKDYTLSTYEKYEFMFNKVKGFIISHLKKKDLVLKSLTIKFIMDFDVYMRVNDNNQHNTAVKYCLNLKKVINDAVLQNIIPQNPFKSYKTVYKETPQLYLEANEVSMLENVSLVKPSHILVRDLFIFQCYTGLAYTDLISLCLQDIRIDSKGKKWIIKARQKTGIISTIPLLPPAEIILNKNLNLVSNYTSIFPNYSIQKYNQYLGEVGKLAGLNKKISSHVGRRTLGNLGLSKGVSLNVISKILGHANTIITQKVYAITTQDIISREIEKW